MPTGYTAIIEERADLTFREFALRCARGMGACVMQRDDPMDELPKAPEPSDYYEKRKREATAKLVELRGLDVEGARVLWQAECERITKRNAESISEAKDKELRYRRMRDMVSAWTPPTKNHEGLKRFMLEQIDLCHSDWKAYTTDMPPSPEEWLAAAIKSAEWDLEYATKNGAEEVERTRERKEWIEALYASV